MGNDLILDKLKYFGDSDCYCIATRYGLFGHSDGVPTFFLLLLCFSTIVWHRLHEARTCTRFPTYLAIDRMTRNPFTTFTER